MRTYSYISAAALAAALIATPQLAQAQLLGVDIGIGGAVDAGVTVGGDSLLDVDVNPGDDTGSGGLLDVEVDTGGPDSDSELLEVSIGGGAATGPNGGTLIDLGPGRGDEAVIDADIDLGNGSNSGGSTLLNGAVRIGSLGEGDDRVGALLGLIENPDLGDIDLDAVIDDTRVSIIAAAELLGRDELAEIEAAITAGGAGRGELLGALSASVELGAILGNEGIDVEDVLAVQIAEDGATEVIVLGGDVEVAALGGDGNLATVTADDVAELDIDLLSREELAAVDLDLLPDELRSTAQLRLLGVGGDAAEEPTPADLAAIDLDLLSRDELGELDLGLLPEPVGAAIQARLLGNGEDQAGLSGDELAIIRLNQPAEDDGDTGASGTVAEDDGGTSGSDDGEGDNGAGNGADDGSDGGIDIAAAPAIPAAGASRGASVGAFGIAALDCEIGVLALANGLEATPQAIAGAESLELVQIEGCERSLVDADADQVRGAISGNPAVSEVLEDAQIPLEQVIGATVQAETLTLFIEAATES